MTFKDRSVRESRQSSVTEEAENTVEILLSVHDEVGGVSSREEFSCMALRKSVKSRFRGEGDVSQLSCCLHLSLTPPSLYSCNRTCRRKSHFQAAKEDNKGKIKYSLSLILV